MAWAFITSAQLINRLSSPDGIRLLDDDRDGVADATVVAQLIADASSKVAGYLQGLTNTSLTAIEAAAQADEAHEVVRLTLDAAEWMAIKRRPGAARDRDWVELMKANNSELKMLRQSMTKIDTDGAPNEPENVGGAISPTADSTATARTFRAGGWGDF